MTTVVVTGNGEWPARGTPAASDTSATSVTITARRDPGDPALTAPRPKCRPEGLRAKGWRQGCRLQLSLPLVYVHARLCMSTPVTAWLRPKRTSTTSGWLSLRTATSRGTPSSGATRSLSYRPVFYDNPPQEWGIRSARFKVDGSGAHIQSEAAAVRVTPDVLLHASHLTCLHPAFTRGLKTWLGLRYDRPAVPEVYIDLARDIAGRIKKNRSGAEPIRDVLAVFDIAADGTIEYQVVAVVPSIAANSDPDLSRQCPQVAR